MKHTKKLISVLLMVAMMLVIAMPAFAAEDDNSGATSSETHTITITNEKAGHTYTAYQVFAGDISVVQEKDENSSDENATKDVTKLTNITWGAGVDGDALLAELKTMKDSPYASCETAEAVAEVLKGFGNNSQQIDAFATIVGKHLATAAGTSAETGEAPNCVYTINVTGDGYYFVKDTGTIGQDDASTKYILQVLGNVSIQAKDDTPTIDKVIVSADSNNGGEGEGTAQDVGSKVDFKLTSTVPAMEGYTSYEYIVSDTMSDGLTFNNDVKVTIGGVTYEDFTVTTDGQTFKIIFNNFIDQKTNAGKEIVITYSATLNEKALTTDVETNTVHLEYSNNPNDDTSKGKTPDVPVYVYDFDIVIDKYTGDATNGTRLKDAKFVLKNEAGQYYFWNAETKKVIWVTLGENETLEAAIKAGKITEVTTDENGAAKFNGLDSGTYKLTETEAPAGYNKLPDDITVTITATYNEDGTLDSSSATSTNNGQYSQTTKIENKAGTTLPSTGGIGTTIFYVIGSVLLIGAAILLVTERRMKLGKN